MLGAFHKIAYHAPMKTTKLFTTTISCIITVKISIGTLSFTSISLPSVHQFKTVSKFLIANKSCAGYGLNLQFCSYIIYYSNDWDYATRAQSEDRVHRIGQNKNVHIIDICAAYTLDEKIIKCLNIYSFNFNNSFQRGSIISTSSTPLRVAECSSRAFIISRLHLPGA